MKYATKLFTALAICSFPVIFFGCEKAQQAIDAADKAKVMIEGFQKKVKEVAPGIAQKPGAGKESKSGDKEKDHKDD